MEKVVGKRRRASPLLNWQMEALDAPRFIDTRLTALAKGISRSNFLFWIKL
jgi:hypothetical protein